MSQVPVEDPVVWNRDIPTLNKLIEHIAELVSDMVCVVEGMYRPEMPWRKLPGREYTEAALKRIKEQYPPTSSSANQTVGGKAAKPLTYVEVTEVLKKEFDAEVVDKPEGVPF